MKIPSNAAKIAAESSRFSAERVHPCEEAVTNMRSTSSRSHDADDSVHVTEDTNVRPPARCNTGKQLVTHEWIIFDMRKRRTPSRRKAKCSENIHTKSTSGNRVLYKIRKRSVTMSFSRGKQLPHAEGILNQGGASCTPWQLLRNRPARQFPFLAHRALH